MPKDSSTDDALPFPGEYGPDGFSTQNISLGHLTNTELKEHCKTFKLPHSGNKAILTQRLVDFSGDKARWDSLLPGATNTHKGSRKPATEKKTKPKVSALRRESLFHGIDGVRVPNAPVTERSKDLRTTEAKAAIMPWAKRIVEQYPYQRDRRPADANASIYGSSMPTPATAPPPTTGPAPATVPMPTTTPVPVPAPVLAPVPTTAPTHASTTAPAPLATTAPAPALALMPTPTAAPVAAPTLAPGASTDVFMSSTNGVIGIPPDDEDPIRTLKLAGGNIIAFRDADIPDPPAARYSACIEDLLVQWDDNSPLWDGTSPLKINGVPIALAYWPSVYRYCRAAQWRGVKKQWFDWKILVRAMSVTTLEEFWARYSVTSKTGELQRMKYTPLLTRLSEERKAENARLAEAAQRELTPEQLTYRKGGQYIVMKKPAMIAAQYRKLKGMDADNIDDDEGDD